MKIITKEEAKKSGLIFYFTGKPCKYGHMSERLVNGGSCRECKIKYGSQYRESNRETYNEYCRKKKKESYTTEKRRISYRKNIKQEIFQAAKTRAKNKKIAFTITLEDVIIPEICPVLGIPLDTKNKESRPSLDRIINSKGYVKGNVSVISLKANRLKNNGTIDEFEKILSYMKNNKNG